MRTVVVVVLASLFGALLVLGLQTVLKDSGSPGEPGAEVGGTQPEAARESLPGKLADDPSTLPADAVKPAMPRLPGPRFGPGAAVEESVEAPSKRTETDPAVARRGPAVGLEKLSAFERERHEARATFDTGDRALGAQLLRAVYSVGQDRAEVDLTPEVERLLQAEETFMKRRELAEYLSRRGGSSTLFAAQQDQAFRVTAEAEAEPQQAVPAWRELSLAYEMAPGELDRRKILTRLEPFLERMVFSGRYSPLLRSYTVASGDSLDRIARKFGTTVEAIRRLNKLANDVIQPRRRLRVLEGRLRVYVDKSDFRLWVTVDDMLLFERPVGLGLDNGTPTGTFVIGVRQKDPTWWRPGQPPLQAGHPENVLGTRWLGFQDTDELAGYGIHGTADSSGIGRESSAGCVRLRNEDVELVYDFVGRGTPVTIRP